MRAEDKGARKFKQEYTSGLVRPQVVVNAGSGKTTKASLANDADNTLLDYGGGEFVNAAAERERLIYTDPQTGLQWVRNGNLAGKMMFWQNAMDWARNLTYAGYHDWRLPTREELEAFSKRGGSKPSQWYNSNGLSNVQFYYYWSSSTYAGNTSSAWYVYMGYGYVGYGNKGVSYYVWPVRAGQ